jgi:hypothetical protein
MATKAQVGVAGTATGGATLTINARLTGAAAR